MYDRVRGVKRKGEAQCRVEGDEQGTEKERERKRQNGEGMIKFRGVKGEGNTQPHTLHTA